MNVYRLVSTLVSNLFELINVIVLYIYISSLLKYCNLIEGKSLACALLKIEKIRTPPTTDNVVTPKS